jgi:hypothetical protein
MSETYTPDKEKTQQNAEQKEIPSLVQAEVDNKLGTLATQSSVSLQTVEREVQEEKKPTEETENEAWLAFSQ